MPKTNAQKLASRKYRSNNYETISFEVRKGIRDDYKAAAEKSDLSLAAFFKAAAEEFIERHGGETVPRPSKPDPLPAADKRLVEEFNQLPVEVKGTIRRLIEQVIALQNMPK